MNSVLIRGGRVLDPSEGRDETADILVEDGIIRAIGGDIAGSGGEMIDARGLVVCPGFIDLHVHLREPGREDKETIATGTRAAAAGGFTSICPMPNTEPVIDSASGVNHVLALAARDGVVRVLPTAAVTVGQRGEDIAEFGDLANAGAVAFSDDGRPVADPGIMRRALEYTSMLGRPVFNHAELPALVGDGVIHEGVVSARIGLKGIPAAAETACVARDVEIAAETGGHLHIQHVSTGRACQIIAEAKSRGVNVTAEACPHHLVLTEEAVANFSTLARVSPPLRSAADREAIRAALRDGVIDCVATDHAPHTDIEKDQPFDQAPPGMIGLDFAFALLFTELVDTDLLPLEVLIQRMTSDPAHVLGIGAGTLCIGAPADITILDLEGETRVIPEAIHSRSKNTPFLGRTLRGAVAHTLVGGRLVFSRGEIVVDRETARAR
ncbi:dihydroorotase [Candidatus Sumerlaeota bacterium]|nr:dihydroorotase [Candidatus Sumerlaeota bacterium]